jgi:hypothetical protein
MSSLATPHANLQMAARFEWFPRISIESKTARQRGGHTRAVYEARFLKNDHFACDNSCRGCWGFRLLSAVC